MENKSQNQFQQNTKNNEQEYTKSIKPNTLPQQTKKSSNEDKYFQMDIGEAKLHFFKDGETTLDPKKIFAGYSEKQWDKLYLSFFDNIEIVKELRDEQIMRVSFNYVLVQNEGKIFMLDTGIGIVDPPRTKSIRDLREALKSIDVEPKDVDYVILTHLHRDHTGWSMVYNDQNELVPLFTNAKHIIQQKEWDY